MTHKQNFEAVDEMLRSIRRNPNVPCGGLIFVCAGDFRQIPPVVEHGGKWNTIEASVKNTKLWPLFEKITLTTHMRQTEDSDFSEYDANLWIKIHS